MDDKSVIALSSLYMSGFKNPQDWTVEQHMDGLAAVFKAGAEAQKRNVGQNLPDLSPVAFRIKSGQGVERRYTPVFEALGHLLDVSFRDGISFIKANSAPYILEISRDGWMTWEEVGLFGDFERASPS